MDKRSELNKEKQLEIIKDEEKEHQIQMRFKESFHENIQKVI